MLLFIEVVARWGPWHVFTVLAAPLAARRATRPAAPLKQQYHQQDDTGARCQERPCQQSRLW